MRFHRSALVPRSIIDVMATASARLRHATKLLVIAAVAVASIFGCAAKQTSEPAGTSTSPEPSPTTASSLPRLDRGIDLSSHSGTVDWASVARAGYSFAFVKATEGMDLADPSFKTHWSRIKDAGLVRGAYHFYVTEDDPDKQAQFFIDTVTLEPGDLAPVVDIELIGHATQPGLTERLRRMLDRLEQHYGIKPLIYTSPTFWNSHLDDTFGEYPLWIAEYQVDEPRIPVGWSRWSLWQFQGDAAVDGVESSADLSRVGTDVDVASLLIDR